jgi:hypothetical protein
MNTVERHVQKLNESLERERVERAADREMIRKSYALPHRDVLAGPAQQSTDS